MSIKYYLLKNALASTPETCKAVVEPHTIHDAKSIIKQMLLRGTTLTEPDLVAALHLFFDVVTTEIKAGNHVNLPVVKFRPGISGTFKGLNDSFDATRHNVKVTASVGAALHKQLENRAVEKTTRPLKRAILLSFKDINSQSINDKITPGGIGQLDGNFLKLSSNNPFDKLSFVATNQQEFPVTVFATVAPRQLIFSIPANLPLGDYQIVIQKTFGSSTTAIRKSSLALLLKVT